MPAQKLNRLRPSKRYGAGELFGRPVSLLIPDELRRLSTISNRDVECPFKPGNSRCNKVGGVCSLTLYERYADETVRLPNLPITTCPNRFLEGNHVFKWIGKALLGTSNPTIVSEVPFLMSEEGQEEQAEDEVGRIDKVLVDTSTGQFKWCALEMQAVYFSGGKMEHDFAVMRDWQGPGTPFPAKHRRPDYRSSGPKRLMPQLQIKVPTLRRWGKKMAVVVDRAFWGSLGEMRRAKHVSNADIVWFVVDYDEPITGSYRIKLHDTAFTTLEHAVEGLTGGTPVALEQFEQAIHEKLERRVTK